MSTKVERRSSLHDLIEDIVEPSSASNPISFRLIDSSKAIQNRNYPSYQSLPSLINKTNFEQTDDSTVLSINELRDHLHLTLPRSNSSSIMMSNDDRRKEIDLIIKHLYDGKLSARINDENPVSDISESSTHMLRKEPITAPTTVMIKNNGESKNSVGSIDLVSLDGNITVLQRELQEKELDIIHLHKEIQELQLENKLLKAKVPNVYSNGYANNSSEVDVLRHENDILQNELRASQDLIAKSQQQHQNTIDVRSNKIDELAVQQKEALEKKLKLYEKQMRTLNDVNDKLKQNLHQSERSIGQLKRENEDLKRKVIETKKHNDELFCQEFSSLRNELKMLKQRNNELIEENLRLQQKKRHCAYYSSTHGRQQSKTASSSLRTLNTDTKTSKMGRSESPNTSEASDSTNYLTSVSIERYRSRRSPLVHRSATVNGNYYQHPKKYDSPIDQEDIHRDSYSLPFSRSVDQKFNIRSFQMKRALAWDEENIQANEDIKNYDDDHLTIDDTKSLSLHFHRSKYPIHRSATFSESQHYSSRTMDDNRNDQQYDAQQIARNVKRATPRRPYAPSSIGDIHLNDIVKFSRPGGKISKGTVKYIGSLPGTMDQYLGLELTDEGSKHDGVYQGQRLFQCKPNKGIFIGFNKIIMAWSEM